MIQLGKIGPTLQRLESAAYLSPAELRLATKAESSGTPTHTIGYEIEVLPSALPDIGWVQANLGTLPARDRLYKPGSRSYGATGQEYIRLNAHRVLTPYGYGVVKDGGVYELQSPPAQHPDALSIATSGVSRAGWLPDGTRGRVTAHVSIGTVASKDDVIERAPGLVDTLRMVEQLGMTTPGRLMQPIHTADRWDDTLYSTYSWNSKGTVGVKIDIDPVNSDTTRWNQPTRRVEFRTLGFYKPEQFQVALTGLYYLTRAAFAPPATPAATEHAKLQDWFNGYQERHQLPTTEDVPDIYDHPSRDFKKYMLPYAQHLRITDRLEC